MSQDENQCDQANESKQNESAESGKSSRFPILRIVLIVCLLGYAASICLKPKAEQPVFEILSTNGNCMGTTWNVKICEPSFSDGEKLFEIVQKPLDDVDAKMSTFKPNSELSRFNQSTSTDWFEVSAETVAVVQTALDVSAQTDGAFDITVGPLVDLWRFGPNKTQTSELPSSDEIASTKNVVGYQNLETRTIPSPAIRKTIPELRIDLSAIAKGFAVDQVARALETNGIQNYMVEVGGEIRCNGQKSTSPALKTTNPQIPDASTNSSQSSPASATGETVPWILVVEQPNIRENPGDSFPVVYRKIVMRDGLSLATSGDYRNFRQIDGVRFSHIIDPRTGRPTVVINENDSVPTKRLGSVSVFLPDCLEADAYATAFFVLGEKDGVALADKLGIPVLFISRTESDDVPRFEETRSRTFDERIESEKY